METVILVSVLATLGVVAIVVAIVVVFKRLANKVDVDKQNNYDIEFMDINRRVDGVEQNIGNELNEVHRTIDSRCDKLYDLITNKK